MYENSLEQNEGIILWSATETCEFTLMVLKKKYKVKEAKAYTKAKQICSNWKKSKERGEMAKNASLAMNWMKNMGWNWREQMLE